MRGELKIKARPIVGIFYCFGSGQNQKIIASNRELAEGLKEFGYAYAVSHIIVDLSHSCGLRDL